MDDQPTLLGGPDAQDRDPGNHNDFLKVSYTDVICEPPSVRSPECSYHFTKKIFDCSSSITYDILTLTLGGLLSLAYGLFFGIMSFVFVWFVTPFTRMWLLPLGWFAKIWWYIVKCFYDPLYLSCGRIFSNININFRKTAIQNV